jgi:pyoverdine/dityrosine biosynthesis protein Dit1
MSHTKPLDIDAILATFRRFSQLEDQEHPDKAPEYEDAVASKIRDYHKNGKPISLLLPAAPFKNPCPEKVLDTKSPDFAEELGLSRLNHLCDELTKVYSYGAELTMISDGPVYNGRATSCLKFLLFVELIH